MAYSIRNNRVIYEGGVGTDQVRCVSHPEFGLRQFAWNKDCDNSAIGINEETQKQKIKVYPNPVNNVLSINLPTSEQAMELSLFSSSGQLVLSEPLSSYENSIDVSGLSKGLYFYQIGVDGKMIQQGKLMME